MNILLLGDFMGGENLFHLGRGILTQYRSNYHNIIDHKIRFKLFSDCDIIVLNMEYSLVENIDLSSKMPQDRIYRAHCDSLETIDDCNHIVFNVANNHFSQHGIESSILTKSLLKSHNVHVIGTESDPLEIELNEVRIKLWGISMVTDAKYCGEYNLCDYSKYPLFKRKEKNEFWVVSLHWGDEYSETPKLEQQKYARMLIDKGVNVVMGHHPHVVQPIEFYQEGIILYSLGNFLFDQNFSKETQTGLAVKIDLNDVQSPRLYKTHQKNFRIVEANEASYNEFMIDDSFRRCRKHRISRNKARLLMKIEFLANFFRTDMRVILTLFAKNIFKKSSIKI